MIVSHPPTEQKAQKAFHLDSELEGEEEVVGKRGRKGRQDRGRGRRRSRKREEEEEAEENEG